MLFVHVHFVPWPDELRQQSKRTRLVNEIVSLGYFRRLHMSDADSPADREERANMDYEPGQVFDISEKPSDFNTHPRQNLLCVVGD